MTEFCSSRAETSCGARMTVALGLCPDILAFIGAKIMTLMARNVSAQQLFTHDHRNPPSHQSTEQHKAHVCNNRYYKIAEVRRCIMTLEVRHAQSESVLVMILLLW